MSSGTEITRTEGQELEQTSQRTVVAPPVDIYESADEVLVLADVPGVNTGGLTLNFENNRLDIRAVTATPDVEGAAMFQEFSDVDYRRSFELAPGIDVDGIKAELSGGTLTIHLPKSAALKRRQIPISAA